MVTSMSTNTNGNTVSVINGATNTVIATISVGRYPYGICYNSANGYIYVSNSGDNTVSVINGATNTVIATISVGSSPGAYVTTRLKVTSTYPIMAPTQYQSSMEPRTLSLQQYLWVVVPGAYVTTRLKVTSTYPIMALAQYQSSMEPQNTVIATISVGSGPKGICYDPANGYIYVSNNGASTVSVINGATSTVIATISG